MPSASPTLRRRQLSNALGAVFAGGIPREPVTRMTLIGTGDAALVCRRGASICVLVAPWTRTELLLDQLGDDAFATHVLSHANPRDFASIAARGRVVGDTFKIDAFGASGRALTRHHKRVTSPVDCEFDSASPLSKRRYDHGVLIGEVHAAA